MIRKNFEKLQRKTLKEKYKNLHISSFTVIPDKTEKKVWCKKQNKFRCNSLVKYTFLNFS